MEWEKSAEQRRLEREARRAEMERQLQQEEEERKKKLEERRRQREERLKTLGLSPAPTDAASPAASPAPAALESPGAAALEPPPSPRPEGTSDDDWRERLEQRRREREERRRRAEEELAAQTAATVSRSRPSSRGPDADDPYDRSPSPSPSPRPGAGGAEDDDWMKRFEARKKEREDRKRRQEEERRAAAEAAERQEREREEREREERERAAKAASPATSPAVTTAEAEDEWSKNFEQRKREREERRRKLLEEDMDVTPAVSGFSPSPSPGEEGGSSRATDAQSEWDRAFEERKKERERKAAARAAELEEARRKYEKEQELQARFLEQERERKIQEERERLQREEEQRQREKEERERAMERERAKEASMSPADVSPSASPDNTVVSPGRKGESTESALDQLREDRRRKRQAELDRIKADLEEAERRASEQRRAKKEQLAAETERIQKKIAASTPADPVAAAVMLAEGGGAEGQSEAVRELLLRIEKLEAAARGATELQLSLKERNTALQAEVEELRTALSLYREGAEPTKKKVSLTPGPAPIEVPTQPLPLPALSVGQRVLVHFSDWEYLCATIIRDEGEKWLVRLDSEEEAPVRKERVFAPFEECLRVMRECQATEAAMRERSAKMEEGYKAQVEGITAELRAAKADIADLRRVHGIDVRKVQRPGERTPAQEVLRAYRAEAGVACHVSNEVAEVEEFTRGQRRWMAAQGAHDKDLWVQLSTSAEDVTTPPPSARGLRARLFQLYVDECSDLEVAEVRRLSERDLDPSRVYILDTFSEVFVYVGSHANRNDELEATDAALGVVKHSTERAPLTPVTVVREGAEPLRFRLWFKDWKEREPESEEEEQALEKVEAAEEARTFSYEALLQRDKLPAEVNQACLDEYLAEDEFEVVFGMARSKFVTLPEWKRNELRRLKRLF